jgi:MoaA/NifB/PqqE/SkfB family radical SAM enzyme
LDDEVRECVPKRLSRRASVAQREKHYSSQKLKKIIKINNKLGIVSGISTNLNSRRHLEEVIKTGTAQIRVSFSGTSEGSYEVTHTGGKVRKMLDNLNYLRRLIDKYNSDVLVEMYYHVYEDNIHEYKEAVTLAKQLNFNIAPVTAMMFPDFALDYNEGRKLSVGAQTVHDKMIFSLNALMNDARMESNKNCLLNRVIPVINWDITVMPCSNYLYSKIDNNYLDSALQDIINTRTTCAVCKRCQSHSMHRYFNPVKYNSYVRDIISKNN